MGGIGSGCLGRCGTRPTTEGCLNLDVRWLARRGALAPGHHVVALTQGRKAWRIGVWGGSDGLVLDYSAEVRGAWLPVRECVVIDRTPCHLGGARVWFRCPGCGGRVAVLFTRTGLFRCRQCHGLAYASTREPAWVRQRRKADRLRIKLGGEAGFGQVPPRPVGMRWRTYDRTLNDIVVLDRAAAAGFAADMEALQERTRQLAPTNTRS